MEAKVSTEKGVRELTPDEIAMLFHQLTAASHALGVAPVARPDSDGLGPTVSPVEVILSNSCGSEGEGR
ncbi:MAG: hypothetical protein AMXMBFR64_00200 [Myxococcales bacterium]